MLYLRIVIAHSDIVDEHAHFQLVEFVDHRLVVLTGHRTGEVERECAHFGLQTHEDSCEEKLWHFKSEYSEFEFY